MRSQNVYLVSDNVSVLDLSIKCHVCACKVSRKKWRTAHREECARSHNKWLSSLPSPFDVRCPSCLAYLKLLPKDCGGSFRCDDSECAFRKGDIVNTGLNRLSCFKCDYDLCDSCAHRRMFVLTKFSVHHTNNPVMYDASDQCSICQSEMDSHANPYAVLRHPNSTRHNTSNNTNISSQYSTFSLQPYQPTMTAAPQTTIAATTSVSRGFYMSSHPAQLSARTLDVLRAQQLEYQRQRQRSENALALNQSGLPPQNGNLLTIAEVVNGYPDGQENLGFDRNDERESPPSYSSNNNNSKAEANNKAKSSNLQTMLEVDCRSKVNNNAAMISPNSLYV